MHGDADAETTNSYKYGEFDEYRVLEIIGMICAAWTLGDEINEDSAIEKVLKEWKENENEPSFQYPRDIYTDIVGYDITDHSGQFLASPQNIRVVWYDQYGDEFPVKIEKDGVEHEVLYSYS